MGRLQRDAGRSGRRLHVLVHAGVHQNERHLQLEHAHRELQVSDLRQHHTRLHRQRLALFTHHHARFEWNQHHHHNQPERIQRGHHAQRLRLAKRRDGGVLNQPSDPARQWHRNVNSNAHGLRDGDHGRSHSDDYRNIRIDHSHHQHRLNRECGCDSELHHRRLALFRCGHARWNRNQHRHHHQPEQFQLSNHAERGRFAHGSNRGLLDEPGQPARQRQRNIHINVHRFRVGSGRHRNCHRDRNLRFAHSLHDHRSDGQLMLLGRDTLSGGNEPNQPNTINNSCADGTSGTFHSDESNDRLVVQTTDGSTLAPGKTVKVSATVWAYSGFTSDHLDLYYAADASSPSWVLIGTITPTAAGAQTLSANYTLPSGGASPAVRAPFRYLGSAASCTAGSYNDHDDLVFAVGAGTPGFTVAASPSAVSVTRGSNASSTITVTSVNGFNSATTLG